MKSGPLRRIFWSRGEIRGVSLVFSCWFLVFDGRREEQELTANLEGFDAPEEVGGPGFGGGEGRAPEGENLRALVDALKTFFGFGNGFDGGNPELLGAWRVERDADALPAVFDAEGRTGE